MQPARQSLTISSMQPTFAVRPSELAFNVNALVCCSTISFWGAPHSHSKKSMGNGMLMLMVVLASWIGTCCERQFKHNLHMPSGQLSNRYPTSKPFESNTWKSWKIRTHLGCLLQKAHLDVPKKQSLLMQTSVFVIFFLFYVIPPRLHIVVVQTYWTYLRAISFIFSSLKTRIALVKARWKEKKEIPCKPRTDGVIFQFISGFS